MSYNLSCDIKYLEYECFINALTNEFIIIKIDRIKGKLAALRLGNRFVKNDILAIKKFGDKLLSEKSSSAYIEIFSENDGDLILMFYYYQDNDIHIEHEEKKDNDFKIYLNRLTTALEGKLSES